MIVNSQAFCLGATQPRFRRELSLAVSSRRMPMLDRRWRKPWENHGKIGKPWENHGKTMGKYTINGEILGGNWEPPNFFLELSRWENHQWGFQLLCLITPGYLLTEMGEGIWEYGVIQKVSSGKKHEFMGEK